MGRVNGREDQCNCPELFKYTDLVKQVEATAKEHHDTIVRVRKLHKPVENAGLTECDGCKWIYPCETIQALDGEK